MLDGDWRPTAKIVLLGLAGLTVFLSVLFFGYALGRSEGYFEAQADGYAAQYPDDTDQRMDRCLAQSQPAQDARNCVRQALEADREGIRSEEDLSAQRQMAHWAKWLLIVTLGQLPLNIVGLILLLRTIWQGQEALAHARANAYEELRAYVFPGAFDTVRVSRDLVRIQVPIRNSGQTPARNVKVWVASDIVPYPFTKPLPKLHEYEPIVYHAIGPNTERGVDIDIVVTDDQSKRIRAFELAILHTLRYSYVTYNGEAISHPCFEMWISGPDFDAGKLYVVTELDYCAA